MTPDVIATPIVYPESDGQPIADNTKQYRWIATLHLNLDGMFADRDDVFVAADLLWYPVEGSEARRAPDVFVAFGRPKGERGRYLQWEEGGVAPQVVFEVWSPGNTEKDREDKYAFYSDHGVEEYYLYDPDANLFSAWWRRGTALVRQPTAGGLTSPRLQVRFEPAEPELRVWRPDGTRFLTPAEADVERRAQYARAEAERRHAEAERRRAEAERRHAEAERRRAEAERRNAEAERRRAADADARAEAERQNAEVQRRRAEEEAARAAALAEEAVAERARAQTQAALVEQEKVRASAAAGEVERLLQFLREKGLEPPAP